MDRITPKAMRMAEAGVAAMMADGALDGTQLSAWRTWTATRTDVGDAEGYIRLPPQVGALFEAALRREAGRLERAIAEREDADDVMDLALIRAYVPVQD